MSAKKPSVINTSWTIATMVADHLLHGVGIGLLTGAAATAIGVIATSLIPQWPRIVRLALGEVEPAHRVWDVIPHLASDGRESCPLQTGRPPMSTSRTITKAVRL
ncbi:hypothetical protein EQZ23_18100 [Sphingomonas sp. UV9]|uniref:hypothetical protein n=1 Tax=Sphingomonas sp. UV9 TaxID=1851410 RepID=UPI000FFCB071|nr:hypothetical protein [Sphingomonas sp. UV9]RXD02534.1 hypothetical protein EQZ23_18100 [Sphingomonas sp. UV9]